MDYNGFKNRKTSNDHKLHCLEYLINLSYFGETYFGDETELKPPSAL